MVTVALDEGPRREEMAATVQSSVAETGVVVKDTIAYIVVNERKNILKGQWYNAKVVARELDCDV